MSFIELTRRQDVKSEGSQAPRYTVNADHILVVDDVPPYAVVHFDINMPGLGVSFETQESKAEVDDLLVAGVQGEATTKAS